MYGVISLNDDQVLVHYDAFWDRKRVTAESTEGIENMTSFNRSVSLRQHCTLSTFPDIAPDQTLS